VIFGKSWVDDLYVPDIWSTYIELIELFFGNDLLKLAYLEFNLKSGKL